MISPYIHCECLRKASTLAVAYLRGLLKFHRHLGIPYMPRKPITHLQKGTYFDLDSGETLSQINPKINATLDSVLEKFSQRQLTFRVRAKSNLLF